MKLFQQQTHGKRCYIKLKVGVSAQMAVFPVSSLVSSLSRSESLVS